MTTRRLLLLRHARASAGAGEAGDHGRDLDERGRRDASALGREMHRLRLRPDLVLVSSALRTRRSWELLGGFDGSPRVQVMDRLYLAEPSELLAVLHASPEDCTTLLLIGHNPGLHGLALHLAGPWAPPVLRDGMPTCTLVSLSVKGGWRDLHPGSIRDAQVVGA